MTTRRRSPQQRSPKQRAAKQPKRRPSQRRTTVGPTKERTKLMIMVIGMIITVALVVSMLPSLPGPPEAPVVQTPTSAR